MLSTIATAVTAFVATNLDDVVILMIFFSQVGAAFTRSQIITGQYLGFAALVFASLPGFLGAQWMDPVWIGWLGLVPIALGIRALFNSDDDDDSDEVQAVNLVSTNSPSLKATRWQSRFDPQVFSVAAVTIANGGDNIGIYVPLFASCNVFQLGITLVIFFLMVGIWCGLANWLASHRAIAPILKRNGDRLVPWVLIALGIWILWDNTFTP